MEAKIKSQENKQNFSHVSIWRERRLGGGWLTGGRGASGGGLVDVRQRRAELGTRLDVA
jgi:hypothetical protein